MVCSHASTAFALFFCFLFAYFLVLILRLVGGTKQSAGKRAGVSKRKSQKLTSKGSSPQSAVASILENNTRSRRGEGLGEGVA